MKINKKKLNLYGKIAFFTIVIMIVVYTEVQDAILKSEHQYTIGKVTKIEPNARSWSWRIYVKYYVGSEEYEPFATIYEKDTSLTGKRIYVKFQPDNPGNCHLLLEKHVPQNIKEVPSGGWDKIPKIANKKPKRKD